MGPPGRGSTGLFVGHDGQAQEEGRALTLVGRALTLVGRALTLVGREAHGAAEVLLAKDACIIGERVTQPGVIHYAFKQLGLCAGVTDAPFTSTTEVYPDSDRATRTSATRPKWRRSRQPDVDLQAVLKLLEKDPLLAAAVLRVAHLWAQVW